VEVVSRIELPPEERQTIGALLHERSPATADALERYEVDDNLFSFVPAMA
jgi:hypothetical protein